MIFKPLLAATLKDVYDIHYPVMTSPKLDGIRVVIKGGIPRTRSLLPIRNGYAMEVFKDPIFEHLDGEIISGPPTAKDVFHRSQSFVMSFDKFDVFCLHVFDYTQDLSSPFLHRFDTVKKKIDEIEKIHPESVKIVQHKLCASAEELLYQEQEAVEQGYEGLMIRDIYGRYKCGRSSLKEGFLMKMKRFVDYEAEIIDFTEEQHNANEATLNELGYTQRKGGQENFIGKDTLGALVAKCDRFTLSFNIGIGFDQHTRQMIWDNKEKYLGRRVKIKYQEIGTKYRPRQPVFLGFREPE